MPYNRRQFSKALCAACFNYQPSDAILNFIIGWTRFESSAGAGAQYNLLNTTEFQPGCTNFNSVPVRNFVNFQQGVEANSIVIKNGLYPTIHNAILNNNIEMIKSNEEQVNHELTTWGTGPKCADILASGATGSDDNFPGHAPYGSSYS